MDDRDAARALQHLHRELRRRGLHELRDHLAGALESSDGGGRNDLITTLRAFTVDVELRHLGTSIAVLRRIGEVAEIPGGGAPSALMLDLAPAHQNLVGADSVQLGGEGDFTETLARLGELIAALRSDGEDPSGGRSVDPAPVPA
ncbi:MAG: hypothetical protein J7513_12410 [Solirubrobacteraceae bacterium]|nr:hypothetical protein [Solirubrobacteraceae bacterium]